MRSASLIVALLFCLGCSEGKVRASAEAKTWFESNRSSLEGTYRLLEKCVPKRADNYNVLWANGTSGGSNTEIRCSKGSEARLIVIMKALRTLNLIGAQYYDETGGVSFISQRAGIVTGGSLSEFTYDPHSQNCRQHRVSNEAGDGEEVTPLTEAPCNWFYRTNYY